MKKINVKFIAESAIIAALYAALTWLLAPISYGPIQFRISEILILLVVLNPKFSLALVIGCFVANTTSSLGWYDMLFGTLATTVAIIPMLFVRKMPIAAIFPVIANAFIVALELGIAFELWNEAYWFNVATVALGEAVVLYFLGIPAMSAIAKNETLVTAMELEKDNTIDFKYFNGHTLLAITLAVLNIIFFIAYPLYTIVEGDTSTNYTMFSFAKDGYYWLFVSVLLSILYGVTNIFLNKKLKLICSILLTILITGIYITISILNPTCFTNFFYYLFYILPIMMIILGIRILKKDIKKDKVVESEFEA